MEESRKAGVLKIQALRFKCKTPYFFTFSPFLRNENFKKIAGFAKFIPRRILKREHESRKKNVGG